MKDYLKLFNEATSIEAKWEICQQYHDRKWELETVGMKVGCKPDDDEGRFYITDVHTQEYGKIQVASTEYLLSGIDNIIIITVEPPKKFEDLQDCGCSLFCYTVEN